MSLEVTVRLSWFEILSAAHAGVSRNVSALRDNRQVENGRTDSVWDRHILGAIGELAVAKALNRYWSPAVGRLDTETGDIEAAGVHVKATTLPNGSLIVRPHDPDDLPYVLVVLELPFVRIVGWMLGADAKSGRYWRDVDRARGIHRAAHFVPQDDLNHDIQSLVSDHGSVV